MAIGQSINIYIGGCATLQLEILRIWTISPAMPKGGVWEANQPVLPVENWSQPIANQELIETLRTSQTLVLEEEKQR